MSNCYSYPVDSYVYPELLHFCCITKGKIVFDSFQSVKINITLHGDIRMVNIWTIMK